MVVIDGHHLWDPMIQYVKSWAVYSIETPETGADVGCSEAIDNALSSSVSPQKNDHFGLGQPWMGTLRYFK